MNPKTTIQTRVIFPKHLNDQSNFFGGQAMLWMDEVAYITAARFTGKRMVTVSIENLKFLKIAILGDIVEIAGKVIEVGNAKMKINVEITKENHENGKAEILIHGIFVFASVDDYNRPVRLS
jgi:acyl-CoA hydrolase